MARCDGPQDPRMRFTNRYGRNPPPETPSADSTCVPIGKSARVPPENLPRDLTVIAGGEIPCVQVRHGDSKNCPAQRIRRLHCDEYGSACSRQVFALRERRPPGPESGGFEPLVRKTVSAWGDSSTYGGNDEIFSDNILPHATRILLDNICRVLGSSTGKYHHD